MSRKCGMSTNPFATRFIRPGAIPFLFLDGDSAEALVGRLKDQQWCGQILGEHGSGKSTLLAMLVPLLEAAGRNVMAFKMGPGERRLPRIERAAFTPATQIVIDGYEQLSWWSKWQVRWMARSARAGLLVTAHKDVGLPTVYETKPSEEVTQAVVEKLSEAESIAIARDDTSAAFRAAGGNVRETLFKLFDVYHLRQTGKSPPEILAAIAALPSEPSDPTTSARHDEVLDDREAHP
jgi:energy-coupling factor transporter ATP-binding protein EcfA2